MSGYLKQLLSLIATCVFAFSCADQTATVSLSDDAVPTPRVLGRPTADDANGIFVDALNGSNANPGTSAAPLQNLQWATDVALAAGKVVFVAGGSGQNYTGVWAKTDIYCSYNPSDWSHDPANYTSVIVGGGTKAFGVAVPAGSTATIDSCEIWGGDSFSHTYGVLARGTVHLNRNMIIGGSGSTASYGVLARNASGCSVSATNNLIGGGNGNNATGVVNQNCSVELINNTIISDSGTNNSIGVNVWPAATSTLLVNNILDVSGATSTKAWAMAVVSPAQVDAYNNDFWAEIIAGGHLINDYNGADSFFDNITDINNCLFNGCALAYGNISSAPAYNPFPTVDDGSPCWDTGLNPSSAGYTGPDADTDYNGNARPGNSTWEIGAVEFTVTTYPSVLPSADAMVDSSAINTNTGSQSALWVGDFTGLAIWRSYLDFDPADWNNETVRSATLNVYLSGGAGGTGEIYVWEAASAWEEMVITWSNQPGGTSPFNYELVSGSGWKQFDVTNLITGSPDNGIYIQTNESSPDWYMFMESKEGANPPYLEVVTTK